MLRPCHRRCPSTPSVDAVCAPAGEQSQRAGTPSALDSTSWRRSSTTKLGCQQLLPKWNERGDKCPYQAGCYQCLQIHMAGQREIRPRNTHQTNRSHGSALWERNKENKINNDSNNKNIEQLAVRRRNNSVWLLPNWLKCQSKLERALDYQTGSTIDFSHSLQHRKLIVSIQPGLSYSWHVDCNKRR